MKKAFCLIFISTIFSSFSVTAQNWTQVSTGVSSAVEALALYKGDLLAGGRALKPMQQWDGSSWSDFSSSSPFATSILVDGDSIFAGGTFAAGVNQIFKYDGSSWSVYGNNHTYDSVSTSLNGDHYSDIFKLKNTLYTLHDEGLMWYDRSKNLFRYIQLQFMRDGILRRKTLAYAGILNNLAYFYSVTDTTLNTYDGASWNTIKIPSSSYPYALPNCVKVFNGAVYLSGSFMQGSKYYSLIKFDGTSTFSNVMQFKVIHNSVQQVNAIFPVGGYLFALYDENSYTRAGIINDSSIIQLGDSLYSGSISFNCFQVYNSEIYLGGYFASAAGISALNIIRISVPSGIPAAPSSLTIVPVIKKVADSKLQLSWADNSSNESGFRIYRSTDSLSFTKTDSVGANTTSYKDTALNASSKYYYKICAYNASGASAFSEIASATTFSGINGSGNLLTVFDLYPNPAKDILYMHYKGTSTQSMNISLVDLKGRIIFSQQMLFSSGKTEKINLSQFTKGIYILKALNDNQISYSKLLVE